MDKPDVLETGDVCSLTTAVSKGASAFRSISHVLRLSLAGRYGVLRAAAVEILDVRSLNPRNPSNGGDPFNPRASLSLDVVLDVRNLPKENELMDVCERGWKMPEDGSGCVFSAGALDSPYDLANEFVAKFLLVRVHIGRAAPVRDGEDMDNLGRPAADFDCFCLAVEHHPSYRATYRVFSSRQVVPMYFVSARVCTREESGLCRVPSAESLAEKGDAAIARLKSPPATCKMHDGWPLVRVCEDCETFLCSVCEEEHRRKKTVSHRVVDVHDALDRAKRSLQTRSGACDRRRSEIETNLVKVDVAEKEVEEAGERVKASAVAIFEAFMKDLEGDLALKNNFIQSARSELLRQAALFDSAEEFARGVAPRGLLSEVTDSQDLSFALQELELLQRAGGDSGGSSKPRKENPTVEDCDFLKHVYQHRAFCAQTLMATPLPVLTLAPHGLKVQGSLLLTGRCAYLEETRPEDSASIPEKKDVQLEEADMTNIREEAGSAKPLPILPKSAVPPEKKSEGDSKPTARQVEMARLIAREKGSSLRQFARHRQGPGRAPGGRAVDRESQKLLDQYARLQELVLRADMISVHLLCTHTPLTSADSLSVSLLSVFEANDLVVRLFRCVLDREISGTEDQSTSFRNNSVATKVITRYLRRVGQPLLHIVFSSILKGLMTNPVSFEIDPDRLGPMESKKQNMRALLAFTTRILDSIVGCTKSAPMQFRQICRMVSDATARKFQDFSSTAVAGFIFLRFFCPALVGPEGYDLIRGEPTPKTRRNLVLVTKIVQNLASGVEFRQKESYMMPLNTYLQSKHAQVQKFLEEFVDVDPPREDNDIRLKDGPFTSGQVLALSLQELYRNFLNIRPQLDQAFTACEERLKDHPDDTGLIIEHELLTELRSELKKLPPAPQNEMKV